MSIITTPSIHNTLYEIISGVIKGNSEIKLSLTEKEIISLCSKVSQTFSKEPQIIPLRGNFIIVGDIHGSIDSLLRIFNHFNYPPKTSYIFLGDYIDRGKFSCEVIIFLYSLKILYPMNIFMIRGNHECESMASTNGFKKECLKKYSKLVYEAIIKSFDFLSIAIELNFKIFCVHGGISPLFTTIQHVNRDNTLKKPLKEPFPEIINDFLWSDPSNSINKYSESPRTIGKLYGFDAVKEFLEKKCNNLALLVRSHEMIPYGYEYPFNDKGKVLTIFSSIDYCGNDNSGSVAVASESNLQIEEFEHLSPEEKKKIRYIYPDFILLSSGIRKLNQIQSQELSEKIPIESLYDDFSNDNIISNLAS